MTKRRENLTISDVDKNGDSKANLLRTSETTVTREMSIQELIELLSYRVQMTTVSDSLRIIRDKYPSGTFMARVTTRADGSIRSVFVQTVFDTARQSAQAIMRHDIEVFLPKNGRILSSLRDHLGVYFFFG